MGVNDLATVSDLNHLKNDRGYQDREKRDRHASEAGARVLAEFAIALWGDDNAFFRTRCRAMFTIRRADASPKPLGAARRRNAG